jgi:type I restriction enzyme R subunit
MATGTGKTYTAFQIIWRLWKSGAKKRILFLADRNILIDQTMVNDFRPFKGAMAKLSAPTAKAWSASTRRARLEVDDVDLAVDKTTKKVEQKLRDLPLALPGRHRHRRQSATSTSSSAPIFLTSSWWTNATGVAPPKTPPGATSSPTSPAPHMIGLTATPKETKDVSNTDYFGEPVYTYSLKQGIEDGLPRPVQSHPRRSG